MSGASVVSLLFLFQMERCAQRANDAEFSHIVGVSVERLLQKRNIWLVP